MTDEMPRWHGKPIDEMDDNHLRNTIKMLREQAATATIRSAQLWQALKVFKTDNSMPEMVGPAIRGFDYFSIFATEKDRLASDMQAILETRELEAQAPPRADPAPWCTYPECDCAISVDRQDGPLPATLCPKPIPPSREQEIDAHFDAQERARGQAPER